MTYQEQRSFNFQNNELLNKFEKLTNRVKNCTLCKRMQNSCRILGHSSGNLNAKIMFIGEAPGRLGADDTGIPFHGDKAGHNFEELLNYVGISREDIFITNAVLCNPKDEKGNNATPKSSEIKNCSKYLKEQIDLIDPKVVVTLGLNSLKATTLIENHDLSLSTSVRTKNSWYKRILIPAYHPGQRAMIHRSMANQRSDYQFIAETIRNFGIKKHRSKSKINPKLSELVKVILSQKNEVTYFALHKLIYLLEYNFKKENGNRLIGAYFIRQKDGPYCTDLHLHKLKNSISELKIRKNKNSLNLSIPCNSLFEKENKDLMLLVNKYIESYFNISDEKLKTSTYLTKPMRNILKLEKNNKLNMYNAPIYFD